MVATVLIGKAPRGQGVSAAIAHLGDDRDPEFARWAATNTIRSRVSESWSQLDASVVPSSSMAHNEHPEMVFKVARFALRDEQVWTWIGCYAAAKFAGNMRDGTYIGAGLLSFNEQVPAQEALVYVTRLVQQMQGRMTHGIVSESVTDMIAYGVRISSNPFEPGTGLGSYEGLEPRSPRRLFIDLSGFSNKDDYDRELTRLLADAQSAESFSTISELMIGNSPTLAKRASASGRYSVRTSAEWYRQGPARGRPNAAQQAASPTSNPNPRPSTEGRTPSVDSPFAPGDRHDRGLDLLREDILRIEDKVERLSGRRGDAARGSTWKDDQAAGSKSWGRRALIGGLVLLVLAVCALTWVKWGRPGPPDADGASQGEPLSAEPAASEVATQESSAAPSVSTTGCSAAQLPGGGELSESQAASAQTEINCLRAARTAAATRIEALKARMPQGAAPSGANELEVRKAAVTPAKPPKRKMKARVETGDKKDGAAGSEVGAVAGASLAAKS